MVPEKMENKSNLHMIQQFRLNVRYVGEELNFYRRRRCLICTDLIFRFKRALESRRRRKFEISN